MRNIKAGLLWKTLIFVAAVFLAVAGLHSDVFKIRDVRIEESPESAGHEVFENLSPRANEMVRGYLQQNIWWVNVSEIGKRIRSLPGVKNVVVERLPPNSIKVTVLPEQIRFLYVTGNGKFFPVTESSTVLRDFKSRFYPDSPITRDQKIIKNSKIRSQAVDLVSSLPPTGLFSQSTVAEIEFKKNSEGNSDFWLSLIQPDVKVKMNTENAAVKAERVARVLNYTHKHNLHARVIDAEYSKKVVVKLRKGR
jgi:cell division protein FtsQ